MKRVEFLDDLLGLLTVKLIMTSKDRFVTCRNSDSVACINKKLEKYDLLPVAAKKTEYFVSRKAVEQLSPIRESITVEEIKQPVSENLPISEDEPIHRYLLSKREHVFVTRQNEVVGIVTPADLNKPPSKMLFYVAISCLEQLLIRSIEDLGLSDREIEGCIGFNRWWDALGRHELARRGNFQLSQIACLNTSELISITCIRTEMRKLFECRSKSEAVKSLSDIADLRNKIMHSGHFIVQNSEQLSLRREQYERIRRYIGYLTQSK